MDAEYSYGKLVIDETILISSDNEDEDEDENRFANTDVTIAVLKRELLAEDTYTCNICNESFKYNIALLCHMQKDHQPSSKEHTPTAENSKKHLYRKKIKKNNDAMERENSTTTAKLSLKNEDTQRGLELIKKLKAKGVIQFTKSYVSKRNDRRPTCTICKKIFPDAQKLIQHNKLVMQFACAYCKSKFCWESKYKRHLFRVHKLSAAVVCKLCSQVFSDMSQLNCHTNECGKNIVTIEQIPKW